MYCYHLKISFGLHLTFSPVIESISLKPPYFPRHFWTDFPLGGETNRQFLHFHIVSSRLFKLILAFWVYDFSHEVGILCRILPTLLFWIMILSFLMHINTWLKFRVNADAKAFKRILRNRWVVGTTSRFTKRGRKHYESRHDD